MTKLLQRFSQDCDRPPGIEDFFCCQRLGGLPSISFFGVFCIKLYKFLISSSFEAAGTVDRIRNVVLERGEQERPKFTFEPINASQAPGVPASGEKNLGSGPGRHPANVRDAEQKCRVDTNRAGTTRLKRTAPLRLTLRRPHDDRPARGVKARRALRWRTMVAFHKNCVFRQQ